MFILIFINVDLGAPTREFLLFKAVSTTFINIRMKHYQKEFKICGALKNKASV